MYTEELTKEGIVKKSKDGIATIVISTSDNCEECTAKHYCKPGNSKEISGWIGINLYFYNLLYR